MNSGHDDGDLLLFKDYLTRLASHCLHFPLRKRLVHDVTRKDTTEKDDTAPRIGWRNILYTRPGCNDDRTLVRPSHAPCNPPIIAEFDGENSIGTSVGGSDAMKAAAKLGTTARFVGISSGQ